MCPLRGGVITRYEDEGGVRGHYNPSLQIEGDSMVVSASDQKGTGVRNQEMFVDCEVVVAKKP